MRHIKKILIIITSAVVLVSICVSLTSCELFSLFDKGISDMKIVAVNGEPGINQSITLKVMDVDKRTFVNSDDIVWSSTEPSVASVDGQGNVKIKQCGYSIITARHISDLTHSASYELFIPYDTEHESGQLRREFVSAELIEENVIEMVKYFKKNVLQIVSLAGGSIGALITSGKLLAGKDTYWFSTLHDNYRVENGIVYTISDWGNDELVFMLNEINASNIYASVQENLSGADMGGTFDEAVLSLQSQLTGMVPETGVYKLDHMEPEYEYRVVVRADYYTFIREDYYSNGLLVGLGMGVADVFRGNIDELHDNWSYQKYKDEIFQIDNARICIERRLKNEAEVMP